MTWDTDVWVCVWGQLGQFGQNGSNLGKKISSSQLKWVNGYFDMRIWTLSDSRSTVKT